MNESNLMPIKEVNSRRTREQHSADSRKGGIASGEARRRKKTLKEELITLLETDNNNNKISTEIKKKALSGDIQAFTTIRDTIGEKPVDKVEQEVVRTIKVDVVDE